MVGPIVFLLAALSVTDSYKLIGPRWASGFRSPAHLLAVYLEAGAFAKWQTVPEISFDKSLACSHSAVESHSPQQPPIHTSPRCSCWHVKKNKTKQKTHWHHSVLTFVRK